MLAPSGIGGSAIKSPAIFLVVPAYNPGGSIIEVVRKALPHVAQVVIVDDGCDAVEGAYLQQCLTDEKVTLLVHGFNKGKGVALHTGISHCLAGMQEDDFILTMDSDGQHDPEDIPKFKHLLAQEGDVHFVLGERFEDGEMPIKEQTWQQFGPLVVPSPVRRQSSRHPDGVQAAVRRFRQILRGQCAARPI